MAKNIPYNTPSFSNGSVSIPVWFL